MKSSLPMFKANPLAIALIAMGAQAGLILPLNESQAQAEMPRCEPNPTPDSEGRPVGPNDCYALAEPSYVVSEREIQDLSSGMNIARTTLDATQLDVIRLGGYAFHQRLIAGITSALQQAGTGAGGDHLLCRLVLERALALDAIYLKADRSAVSYSTAASVVLLKAIRLAIQYYDIYDLPRLKKYQENTLLAPDWLEFAHRGIEDFQAAIAQGPGSDAKRQIAARALGWTAKALNTATTRRDFADVLYRLREMQTNVDQGLRSTGEGQQLLKETAERLRSVLNGVRGADAPNFPQGSYPAVPAVAPIKFRALVKSKLPLLGNSLGEEGALHWEKESDYGRGKYSHHIRLQLGAGPLLIKSDQHEALYYNQIAARVQLLESWRANMSSPWGQVYTGIQVDGAPAQDNAKPYYKVKLTQQQALFGGIGVWMGFEKTVFDSFEERIARFGLAPGATIVLDGRNYVMIRTGIGAHWSDAQLGFKDRTVVVDHGPAPASQFVGCDEGINNTLGCTRNRKGNFALELATLVKLSSFLLDVEANLDVIQPYHVKSASADDDFRHKGLRFDVQAALSIPLGIIFGNDSLKIGAGVTSYHFIGGQGLTVGKASVQYGLFY